MPSTTVVNPFGPSANPFYRGRIPVKTNIKIHEGNLVMVGTGTGLAEGAAAVANMRCIGWALEETDNTGGADSAVSVPVSAEPRGFAGKGGDLPTAAMVGGIVYIENGTTVKATEGSNPVTVTLLEIKGSQYICRP